MALAVTNDSGCGGGRPEVGREDYTRRARWLVPLARDLLSERGVGSHATVALGICGEKLACETLTRQGYAILATRYRTRVGEIDIVARDGETLAFVEVKTRTSDDYGVPAEAVTWRKQRRIVTMARWYLTEKGLHGSLCRFDVVTVRCRRGFLPVVEVVKNAFMVS
jgi:putative endonuclease